VASARQSRAAVDRELAVAALTLEWMTG